MGMDDMKRETMKAAVVEGAEHVMVREVTKPAPIPGEVLIKIEYCLICTWEQRIFSGMSSTPLPFIPGHEAAGVVENVPEGTVTAFRPGQRVVFKTLDHCGHCSYCYTGSDNQCIGTAKKRSYDGIGGSGGLAQYISLDPGRVFPLYGDISLEAAAFTEPLACCIHSVKRSSVRMGDTAVIIGAGIMGQLHAVLARLQGARVIVVEPDEERRAFAAEHGAHLQVDPFSTDAKETVLEVSGGEGADIVFVTANNSDLVLQGTGMLRKTGKIVLYGSFHPSKDLPIDPNMVHYSEIIMTGSSGPATEDFYQASKLLSYGLVKTEKLLDRIYPLDQAGEAMAAALKSDTYRVGIKLHAQEKEVNGK